MKITAKVTIVGEYKFATFFGHRMQENTIYKMADEGGKVYVWKTASALRIDHVDESGRCFSEFMNKGDIITISATVKGEEEYKGEPQTALTRVKVLSREYAAETPEEKAARKEREVKELEAEQRASISGGDFIRRMTYKQYKERYADCETVAGSFEQAPHQVATIEVIIREGRLKNSGVRGEHFFGFEMENENGERVCLRAVNEANAEKRAAKIHGGTWKTVRVYSYGASLWR